VHLVGLSHICITMHGSENVKNNFTFNSLYTIFYRRYRSVTDHHTMLRLEMRAKQVPKRLSFWDVSCRFVFCLVEVSEILFRTMIIGY